MDRRAEYVEKLRRHGSVFAEDEVAVLAAKARDDTELDDLVRRRTDGEPIEYLTGRADFAGVTVTIAPGVFVPRHRSEHLVEQAAARLTSGDRLLDLGCGSGALATALSARVTGLEVAAVDADPAAVACARMNLPEARVLQVDDWDLIDSTFDLIVANLPYVPTDEISRLPRDFRDYEHRQALDGGRDGLDPLRSYAPGLPAHLDSGGSFLVEVAESQIAVASAMLRSAGLVPEAHFGEQFDTWILVATHLQ